MINKIRKTKDKVLYLLEQYKHLRDSDNALIANIWYSELQDKSINAVDFLERFSKGFLTTPEAITRARRKIQEENEHLRGESYQKRHKNENEVRTQIHNL